MGTRCVAGCRTHPQDDVLLRGETKEFARRYLGVELELELTPQGTLAEKLRAGGSGIAAFCTRAGVGTQVSEGGLPQIHDAEGNVVQASKPKEVRNFELGLKSADFVLEEAITSDYALVHAAKGDRHGNLIFNKAARQLSPVAAMAGRLCIAQVEELVEPGQLDPDAVHLPGVCVHRIIEVAEDNEKRIEKPMVRPDPASTAGPATTAKDV